MTYKIIKERSLWSDNRNDIILRYNIDTSYLEVAIYLKNFRLNPIDIFLFNPTEIGLNKAWSFYTKYIDEYISYKNNELDDDDYDSYDDDYDGDRYGDDYSYFIRKVRDEAVEYQNIECI